MADSSNTLSVSITGSRTMGSAFQKYTAYTVETQPNGWQVSRRFRDFLWLSAELKRRLPGYIVPNMPEKNIFGKMMKENVIEERSRMLQRFLRGCAEHNKIRNSEAFMGFLEFDEKKFKGSMKEFEKQPVEIDGGDSGVPGDSQETEDLITKFRDGIVHFETRLSELLSTADGLVSFVQESAKNYGAFSTVMGALGQNGGDGSLTLCWKQHPGCDDCNKLANVFEKSGKVSAVVSDHYKAQISVDASGIPVDLKYWIGLCQSAKELVKTRESLFATLKSTTTKAEQATQKLERARSQPAGQEAAIAKLEDQVKSIEAEITTLERKIADFTRVLVKEIDRFHEERHRDMKLMLRKWAAVQIEFTQSISSAFATVLPSIDQSQ